METVSINLAGGKTDNENYLIKDEGIWLKKRNVQYVLEGTTNKKIYFWGLSTPEENMKPVYVSLKNGTVLQNGFNTNVVPTTLVLEIPDETTSTVSQIAAVDLTIKGNGTLHSNYIGVNQYEKTEWQRLRITDTTVNVKPAQGEKSSTNCWEGKCILDGSADVTFVSNSDDPPLKVGQGKGTHSVTLRDSAKLRCLQNNADDPASDLVCGLELFGKTTSLTLEDSSYLAAQGRNSTDEKKLGAAIMSDGDITVKGSAVVNTAAYGDVICTSGAFVMNGGKVVSNSQSGAGIWSASINIKNATVQCTSDNGVGMGSSGPISLTGSNVVTESKNSNGIYSKQSVSVDNAEIRAKGNYPAIYGETGLTVSGSIVDAEGTGDCALYSTADLKIKDSTVKAKAPAGQKGILSNGGVTVKGSWIETSGEENFENAISDSVLFSGKTGTVIGKFVAKHDVKVGSDMSLHIPENASLTIPNGKTFGNEGTITNEGTIKIAGTFSNQGGAAKCKDGHHIGGTATTTKRAKCEICGEEYGDLLRAPAYHGTTSYVPPVEKPNVQVNDGGKTELSKDGKTLTITPGENKAIDKVLLNGKNLGAVTEVKNLKTGDKVEVIFKDKVVEPAKEELAEKVRGLVNDLSKKLTMSKTSEKSRRITVLGDASEIKDMGYTVKYTFYKKGPKDKKYKAIRTTTNNQYKFSKLKNGINRFRARIKVYDKDGKLMASKMTVIKTAKVKKK